MRIFPLLFIVLFLLSACGTGKPTSTDNLNKPGSPLPPAEASVKDGDFIYRLVTEKELFYLGEDISIYAELTYVGEQESIDIFHAASPFYFPITERTRGLDIDYAMNEPLIITTLLQNEPLREDYAFAGGYSDENDKSYIDFVKSLMDDKFPEGEYIVHGYADFWTEDPGSATENTTFKLQEEIGFTVID
ncbi:hypothetical protein ACXYMX_05780 [Sporosarcina sp. CAU 1771]